MNSFTPFQNIKSFIVNGPPLVIFTLSLMVFAITTLSLAYYIGESVYITDPELALDWNMFLSNLARNDFCLLFNNHSTKYSNHQASLGLMQMNQSQGSTDSISSPEKSVSISAVFVVIWSSLQSANVSMIQGNMLFQNINSMGEHVNMSVGISFIGERNLSNCSWESNHCIVKQTACLTINGPARLFPKTRMPSTCAPLNPSNMYNQSLDLFISRPRDYDLLLNKTSILPSMSWCTNGSPLLMKYQSDPELTVMLSMHDRSVINLHLMHTSYFLFVMVITVFCYAILKGKSKSVTIDKTSFEKVPSSI